MNRRVWLRALLTSAKYLGVAAGIVVVVVGIVTLAIRAAPSTPWMAFAIIALISWVILFAISYAEERGKK